jgi:hypothetical protein
MVEPTGTIIGYVPTSKTLATEFTDERGLVIKDDETILRSGKVNKRPVREFLTKEQALDQYKVPDKVFQFVPRYRQVTSKYESIIRCFHK